MTQDLKAFNAEPLVTFKLKDWGLSRQRYWGTPIPTVHCPKCGVVPELESHLPVQLPESVAFTGQGASPLTTSESFLKASCPVCGDHTARRETDTMDTFVDSSWYFMRYLDPHNTEHPFALEEAKAWMPVNLYIGGVEHATMHLIYARYFFKVLRDLGMTTLSEPFQRLICQGMVLKDGFKMSKSKGNIVDPDEVVGSYGADALRLFMIFASPIEKEIDWLGFEGIEGAARFMKRIDRLMEHHVPTSEPLPETLDPEAQRVLTKLHQTIQKITQDLEERYSFNTVVSSLMELFNAVHDLPMSTPHYGAVMHHVWERFVTLLAPVAPHFAEYLWEKLGHQSVVALASWPVPEKRFLTADTMTLVVQINGKVRARLTVPSQISDQDKEKVALSAPEIQSWLLGKTLKKVVVPSGSKIVSLVVVEGGV